MKNNAQPLKRTKGLQRGEPLKARKGLQSDVDLRRRRAIRKESEKHRRQRKENASVREAVIERDGRCILAERLQEHPDFPPHTCGGILVPNHAWKAGQGGPYTPENLDAVCWLGNAWIEDWPLEAREMGLVR